VATVRLDVPLAVVLLSCTLLGLNLPVAAAGNALTLEVTSPVKPPLPFTVTVYVVAPPAVTDRVAGDSVTMKSAAAGGGAVPVQVGSCTGLIHVPQRSPALAYSSSCQTVHPFGSTDTPA